MNNTTIVIDLVFGLAIGIWMYNDAKNRKLEKPSNWLWIGLLFSIFGLLTYWFWHIKPKNK
jgi:hypothetical protein